LHSPPDTSGQQSSLLSDTVSCVMGHVSCVMCQSSLLSDTAQSCYFLHLLPAHVHVMRHVATYTCAASEFSLYTYMYIHIFTHIFRMGVRWKFRMAGNRMRARRAPSCLYISEMTQRRSCLRVSHVSTSLKRLRVNSHVSASLVLCLRHSHASESEITQRLSCCNMILTCLFL